MKIIIPASGSGQRFKNAGYEKFKPLINVSENKTVIDYVIDCFDKSLDEFIFISSPETFDLLEDHLMTLEGLKYSHLVYAGPKLGPVGAIAGSYKELNALIDPQDRVIVSYCDYGMKWGYKDFLNAADSSNADGIIPCYSGYHPHLANENNVYAACKTDEFGAVYSVEEKYKSKKRLSEKWSAGLYYFSKYSTMKLAFDRLIASENKLNGEYYVSLAYNEILDKNICTYDRIEKFYQFGTPEDFEYAKSKLNQLEDLDNSAVDIKNTVILSAGKGERFLNLGFKQPKPFIPIGNSDFVTRISDSLTNLNTEFIYVGSQEHAHFWQEYPNVRLVTPNKIGAAFSYNQACSELTGETLIVPCDLLAKYTTEEFLRYKETSDVIVFVVDPSDYAIKHKESFAWVKPGLDNSIEDISIKRLDSLSDQLVLIGSFWVRDNSVLIKSIEQIFANEVKTNGEYYLDNAFKWLNEEARVRVKYVKLDKYFSLGTFDEYQENNYWLK